MKRNENGRRRILRPAVALAGAALLTLGLGGCGGDSEADEPSAESLAPSLLKPGLVRVCSDMPYAPFESMVGGKPVGFDIDLVKLVAEKLDAKLVIRDTDFEEIESGRSLNSGDCDMVISAMTITGERARLVDFSSPYFQTAQALVTRRGSGIDSMAALAGRKVGVQAGTTGENYLTDNAPKDASLVPLDDTAAMNSALTGGEVDALFYDDTIVGPFLAKNKDFAVSATFETGEQYGIAVRKDSNQALLQVVNGVLDDLAGSKQYDALHKKWFR